MLQVAIIALTAAILVGGNVPGTLKPNDMGSTARCLYEAELQADIDPIYGYPPNVIEFEYQLARNECMWAKAQAKKD